MTNFQQIRCTPIETSVFSWGAVEIPSSPTLYTTAGQAAQFLARNGDKKTGSSNNQGKNVVPNNNSVNKGNNGRRGFRSSAFWQRSNNQPNGGQKKSKLKDCFDKIKNKAKTNPIAKKVLAIAGNAKQSIHNVGEAINKKASEIGSAISKRLDNNKLGRFARFLGRYGGYIGATVSAGIYWFDSKKVYDNEIKNGTGHHGVAKAKQVTDFVTRSACGVGGAAAGWAIGAAVGTIICPGVGTFIGGLVGSCIFGWAGDHLGNYLSPHTQELVKNAAISYYGLSTTTATATQR
jgi:hypothetical protein